jgi:hypothetical protein
MYALHTVACFHGNVLIVDSTLAMDAVLSRGGQKLEKIADVNACEGTRASTVVVSLRSLSRIEGLRQCTCK